VIIQPTAAITKATPDVQVRVCNVYFLLDRVNRRDRFSMKKPRRSSARGASFHTNASNTNVVRVVLLDTNSYLAQSRPSTSLQRLIRAR
jgi:hypothetical protein